MTPRMSFVRRPGIEAHLRAGPPGTLAAVATERVIEIARKWSGGASAVGTIVGQIAVTSTVSPSAADLGADLGHREGLAEMTGPATTESVGAHGL